jgi:hypothetical protein
MAANKHYRVLRLDHTAGGVPFRDFFGHREFGTSRYLQPRGNLLASIEQVSQQRTKILFSNLRGNHFKPYTMLASGSCLSLGHSVGIPIKITTDLRLVRHEKFGLRAVLRHPLISDTR